MPESPINNHPVTKDEMQARYQRARVLMQADSGTRTLALNTTLTPNWIENSESLWYTRETKAGTSYRLVNAEQKTNKPAFNHQQLAAALSEAANKPVDPNHLPLQELTISLSPLTLRFSAFNQHWEYTDKHCKVIETYCPKGKLSPDGRTDAFVRDYNLWVRDIASGEERALTTDGEKFYRYGSEPTVFGYIAPSVNDFIWSPDSNQLFTHLIDTRQVKTAPALVQHVPADGSVRPTLFNADRKLALPGDQHTEMWQFLSINVATGHLQKADCPPCPMVYPLYLGYIETGRAWWDTDSRHVYCIYQELDRTETRVLKLNTQTGGVTVLFKEDPAMDCASMPTSHIRTVMMPLPESNEVIWYSERSGWAHLYLYDLKTGQLKNTLTSGEWLVRSLLHYDAARREVFIHTADRIEGRNPYYCDICRVNIDTGELTTLMSTDHDYSVGDCRYTPSTINQGVSPSANYIVTTRARIDDTPVSLLLDRDGNELLTLETADFSAMPDNWQWPEPVMLKGADNKTDIHGIIYRPSNFDPNKSYPVLDLSWGHSPPITPAVGAWMFYGALAWAELGFIVVKFGNRGGGLRDKAFHDGIDPALPHYNKDDCASGIRQLADRYPYMDINRVGVASFTLYPEASTGLLIHPDLYKVGVDINPMTDARLMPQLGNFGGGTTFPPHEDFVNNLRGKLLLIHGMMEDVVLVGATFRLVEALQKANKHFDMLALPNVDHHGPMDYATRRSWDYMVSHLLGVEPPVDFDMNGIDG